MDFEHALNETLRAMTGRSLYNVPGDENEYKALLKRILIEDEDFMEILDRLQEDKYATYITPLQVDPRDIRLFMSASITKKGRDFLKKGGYVFQKRIKTAKIVGGIIVAVLAAAASLAAIRTCQKAEGNAQPKGSDTTYSGTVGPDHRSASSTMDRR